VPAVIRADGLTSSAACGRRGSPDAVGACCGAAKWGEQAKAANLILPHGISDGSGILFGEKI